MVLYDFFFENFEIMHSADFDAHIKENRPNIIKLLCDRYETLNPGLRLVHRRII